MVVLNKGVSFGIFSNISYAFLLLFLGLLFFIFKKIQASPHWVTFFLAASLSNVLDRVVFGGVRDFLPVPFLGVKNNIADWCIVLSLFVIFLQMKKQT